MARYRRILSGTPLTNAPLDLYSQCAFLDPEALGFASFFTFRAHYAVMVQKRFGGRRAFQHVVAYRNLEELGERLERFSYRVRKEECLDLPPKTYERRAVELLPEQREAYRQMLEASIVEWDRGELTSDLIIVQLLRLHQIACGRLPLNDGTVVDLSAKRVEALLDAIEEVGEGKIVVWATYVDDVLGIAAALAERYGAETVATFYGDTSSDERLEINERFQNPADPLRFFVANRTGARGINLTAASTAVYYSNTYSLDDRLQSEDRLHRIGQSRPCLYIDLVAEGTVDEKILDALEKKEELSRIVIDRGLRVLLDP
jgi:SNF2 family DNA or RNA helicase